jgi:hypothetical protein
MTTLQVFDRPMCCSSGVCGPKVDPALARFAADLDWLKGQGVEVERFNLAHEPAAFTRYDDVKALLVSDNVACLPVVRVDGAVAYKGKYPSRSMLAGWCGLVGTGALAAAGTCCRGPAGCC